jgi:hypothetical protein
MNARVQGWCRLSVRIVMGMSTCTQYVYQVLVESFSILFNEKQIRRNFKLTSFRKDFEQKRPPPLIMKREAAPLPPPPKKLVKSY